jgi:hypothetical protein
MDAGEKFIHLWNEYMDAVERSKDANAEAETARLRHERLKTRRDNLVRHANLAHRRGEQDNVKLYSECATHITRVELPIADLNRSRLMNAANRIEKALPKLRDSLLSFAGVPKENRQEAVLRHKGNFHIFFGGKNDVFGEGHAHYVYDANGIIEYRREKNQPRFEAFRANAGAVLQNEG